MLASGNGAAAAVRPSPGMLIRYLLAPLLLLPLAWPWLVLRAAQAALTAACILATAAADVVLLAAELLRRHRNGAALLTGWVGGWLGWLVTRYWAGLAQLHAAYEDALARLLRVAGPLLAGVLASYPPAAQLVAAAAPVTAAAGAVQSALFGAYCWAHDEIVPVALDLAERLPLLSGLLQRAAASGQ
ncbi:hypothetical protein GPECTOR_88g454 [Gonium pectorale]|uniref:Uncharacterized protein n=1 Tax=Gonium pectorale TaxID=33097 RepID=A0A150G108_GONPE|nr:hypothetical protein GPECTOR_88g454 [Gonium pectorale]|eukprot:KXZ43511.1 hypothetical protein GPECTOR_88g454 [Gonium pectorale]